MKQCSRCGKIKPASEFTKCSSSKDGLHYWCKQCKNEYNILYRQKPEIKSIHNKKYKLTIKGKLAAIRGNRKYFSTPLGKSARIRGNHRYFSHKRVTECTLTFNQWNKIIENQGNKCAYCKKPFNSMRNPTRDHIIPLSKGGGLTFENVQALCQSCNSRKKDRLDKSKIISWGIA